MCPVSRESVKKCSYCETKAKVKIQGILMNQHRVALSRLLGSSPLMFHGVYRLFGFRMVLQLGASSSYRSDIMMAVLQTDQSRRWCIVISLSKFSRRGTCSLSVAADN
ncbi:hypothetical protein AVEN_107196-1 [Araneus ventricosus]|uniref:Uncharacterized protein n=1 Tax=Araneus ventricosus TaxID=182803 RepID=A0A4Y2JEE1_ARAVE|nr:hypothetical protein AVEN_107196-1 [Araneus ventricosus]